jgi:hypothetical protein
MHCLVNIRDLKYVIELFFSLSILIVATSSGRLFSFFSLLQQIQPLRIHSTKYFFFDSERHENRRGGIFSSLTNIPKRPRKFLFSFSRSCSSSFFFFPTQLFDDAVSAIIMIIEEATGRRKKRS